MFCEKLASVLLLSVFLYPLKILRKSTLGTYILLNKILPPAGSIRGKKQNSSGK